MRSPSVRPTPPPFLAALLLIALFVPACSGTHSEEEPLFDVRRLSDRVVVLTERSPMENNIVAVASTRGVVVVDSSGSPVTAGRAREIIRGEFGRDDIAYVVNTHHHWDHTFGNQAFPGATIVGHYSCRSRMLDSTKDIAGWENRFRERLDAMPERAEAPDSLPEGSEEQRRALAFHRRNHQGITGGFKPTPPTWTFDDRLVVDLGDLTLELVYFGRAHSGSDILVFVPEEGLLLTGDLFLEKRWLPLFSGQPELDVPRWIEILGEILDGEAPVRHVVPGHIDVWDREKLARWRDYIVECWDTLRAAEEQGEPLERAMERVEWNPEFSYLEELGHDDAEITTFHRRNLRAFWMQLKENAATIVERTVDEAGLDAALQRYREMRAAAGGEYHFDERAFNVLGYRYLGEGRLTEAIAVFRLNVEQFPGSWNVYDSLGEAYMSRGDLQLAIENYRKSLELNPGNDNAVSILARLEPDRTSPVHLVN